MAIVAPQRQTISVGATRNVAIDCRKELGTSNMTGQTPTIVEIGKCTFDADGNLVVDSDGTPVYALSSDLTISGKIVNVATIAILGQQVPAGKAIQCRVSGQQNGVTYGLRVTVATSDSETLVFDVLLACV